MNAASSLRVAGKFLMKASIVLCLEARGGYSTCNMQMQGVDMKPVRIRTLRQHRGFMQQVGGDSSDNEVWSGGLRDGRLQLSDVKCP